jgi:RNA polymerase sigma factor (sigma-70 family)
MTIPPQPDNEMSLLAIRDYLRVAAGTDPGGTADGELLARFAASRDESAFELLVWRHAALVQRVCRAVLRDHHAAEDAAQATYLVLARKAHTFANRGSVVGWLYRVARRIAIRLAKDHTRHAASLEGLERVPDASPELSADPDDVAELCTEVDRLPEPYRIPILLCFFEGLTHVEAARRTGWPIGTVAGRLARAKDLLAHRLSRKGVGLASVSLALPAGSFVGSTAQAASAFAARNAVIPGVEASTLRLAEGALTTMSISTWKLIAASVAAVFAAATTLGLATSSEPQTAAQTPKVAAARAEGVRPAAVADERVADAKQRKKSVNNLKQILIALHNYHDVNGTFPANVTDKDGKPLLSWRVLLLPYLEQDNLYKQFKLDEPWDSDNNKKLLAMMPRVFKTGIEPKDSTKTYYQGFAGKGTIFEPGEKIKIQSITDGTSNTLAVVECGPAVDWTKPEDLRYDPKKELPKLEPPFTNTIIAAMGDGSVHAFKPDIDEKNLRRLVERADGEVIEVDKLHIKFSPSKEEVHAALGILKDNEKLLLEIAAELREQQKLLADLAKRKLPDEPFKGIDFDRLDRMSAELSSALAALRAETKALRMSLEGKK